MMNEVPTETICGGCNWSAKGDGDYCSNCGAEDLWEEQYVYDWERHVDLPVVFSYEVTDDNYGLWNTFTKRVFEEYAVTGDQIANILDGAPWMKYCMPMLYYKLTEDLELKGPFLDKKEARDA